MKEQAMSPTPLLTPEQQAWYDAQTSDVQESFHRMAANVAAQYGDSDTLVAFRALIDLTIAFRGSR